jgi:DNA-binding beta-propeller fold protein YncE
VTVNLTGQVQFLATVSGATTSTVFWQICLPASKSNQQPTNCTQGVGPTGCTIPTVSSPLVGFGTITSTGLYTAPAIIPPQANFLVLAASCIQATAAGSQAVQIVSAVVLTLKPASATIEAGDQIFLQLTVTGTQNKAVTWTVQNGNSPPIVGGDGTGNGNIGVICPGPQPPLMPNPCTGLPDGTYIAPAAPPPGGSVQVRATSPTDGTPFAQANINVQAAVIPTVTSTDPSTTARGSVQQDVYVTGAGFFITSTVLAGPNLVPVPTTFINPNTLRATIPADELSGADGSSLSIRVRQQNGDINPPAGSPALLLMPVRPAVISSNPDSVPQTVSNTAVNLTGGYYSPGSTTVTFNGQAAAATFVDSRHLSVGVSFAPTPDLGLYPLLVQNTGVAAPSAINLAVRPTSIVSSAGMTIPVGTKPSAIAVDNALHLAVVANSDSGNVSLIDLGPNTVIKTIAIPVINGGTSMPTGVAIDDMADTQLLHDLALVVNNGDNSLAVIDLVTQGPPQMIDLTPFTPSGTEPITVGVNPLSHRALVVNASTNLATVIDLVTPNPNLKPACSTPPCVLTTIGGSLPPFFSVGASPAIAVDPRLNWAVITPGSAGAVDIVDLGRNPAAGDGGRAPRVIGILNITTSVQGVGINTETHQVLLTDPVHTTLTTFSLLDQSVNAVTFTQNGLPFNEAGFVAAAVNPLDNLGVVVNFAGNTATVADLTSGIVLREGIGVMGTFPVAVAIDQATNNALIVDQGANQVAVLQLGGNIRTPQIIEASPAITFAQTASALRLTINGTGFVAGSQVLLDGAPVTVLSNTPHQLVASILPALLGQAHRFIVTVQNPGQLSNATDLTVIKPVPTGPAGSAPFGVAVDNDRDLAVVTNNGNGSVGLIDLTTGSLLTPALSSATTVGTSPEGVAVLPRTGQAIVANNGSNNFTVVDVTGNTPGTTVTCTPCEGPVGVAIDPDIIAATITAGISSTIHTFNFQNNPPPAPGTLSVDQNPGAIAIDPNPDFNFAAVDTLSQSSSVLLVNVVSSFTAKRLTATDGIQLPTGVIFDPLNQFFVVANSSGNNLTLVDPTTFLATPVRVGINPTSLDYNFQTSTLATVNAGSNTMSVIEYTCPPVIGQGIQCPAPRTRAIVGLPDSGQVSQVQQFSVGIDLAMNLAVVADPNNDRVLLIPLPH